jgi:hypothetical protein
MYIMNGERIVKEFSSRNQNDAETEEVLGNV